MLWNRYLQDAVKLELNCRTLAAFNANIDIVIDLLPEDVERIRYKPQDSGEEKPLSQPEHFVYLLKECLPQGKSYYDVMDITLSDFFAQAFPKGKEAIGGQAGIIANQMAALGAKSHLYTSVLSAKQASICDPKLMYPKFNGKVSWVPIRQGVNDTWTKLNYIFEYPKNVTYQVDGKTISTPRANRIILSTRSPRAIMGFDPAITELLPELGVGMDVGFLAGYHHGTIPGIADDLDSFIELSLQQLQALRKGNSHLKLHFEYVPMKVVADGHKLLTKLLPHFNSLGINETEIRKVLKEIGESELAADIEQNERAYALYQGILAISRHFQVPRIQLHNLGYYLLVLRKPYYMPPNLVRKACLYASAVNGVRAKDGGIVDKDKVASMTHYPLSDIGFQQLTEFAQEAATTGLPVPDNFSQTGILELDDHYLLFVPAHVIPDPISTVGMGDTISSAAYAAEVALSLSP